MRYRISKYKNGGWCIERYIQIQSGKRKGTWEWKEFRWPGTLEQTVKFMVDLSVDGARSDFTAEKVSTLLDALENGVTRILDTLEAMPDVESGAIFEL